MNDAVIKSCKCDLCGKREVGIEYYQYGTPVLFVGRCCQPREVTNVASINVFGAVLEASLDAAA
jgi:hypothetical protein